jgi:uncharacterized protein (DUF433 family)/DNA-binding transcriptional MerR regulator
LLWYNIGIPDETRQKMLDSFLLGKGIYSIPEAARILQMQADTIRRWVTGYTFRRKGHERHSPPLIQLSTIDGINEVFLTFQNLIELLFIRLFYRQGVSLYTIRAAASEAQRDFNSNHPFAVKQFDTDGRGIFATLEFKDVEGVAKSKVLKDLKLSQMVIDEIARPYFRNLEYSDLGVIRYYPLGADKGIVLDPKRSFGKPIDEASGVSTHVLYEMARTGEALQDIAKWYGVSETAVSNAIEYESLLKAA